MRKLNTKKALQLLSDYDGKQWRIGTKDGYKTIFCDDKVITQGILEVSIRLNVLLRERGLQFEN